LRPGYTKIAGQTNTAEATRYMAAKASEDPAQVRGQIEMLRDNALGNFRDILVNIAKDTAMLFWLDGNQNTRARPQENFGRRDHGTVHDGRRHYTEPERLRAARVSHRLEPDAAGGAGDRQHYRVRVQRRTARHRRKTFSFPIYGRQQDDSARSAPAACRTASTFIDALAANPNTGAIWRRACTASSCPKSGHSDGLDLRSRGRYQSQRLRDEGVMREVLMSTSSGTEQLLHRYSWPPSSSSAP
jgi:hypothetical protein